MLDLWRCTSSDGSGRGYASLVTLRIYAWVLCWRPTSRRRSGFASWPRQSLDPPRLHHRPALTLGSFSCCSSCSLHVTCSASLESNEAQPLSPTDLDWRALFSDLSLDGTDAGGKPVTPVIWCYAWIFICIYLYSNIYVVIFDRTRLSLSLFLFASLLLSPSRPPSLCVPCDTFAALLRS